MSAAAIGPIAPIALPTGSEVGGPRRVGDGAEENLAVFWETPTASVVLACNPGEGDDDAPSLSQTYSRKVAE